MVANAADAASPEAALVAATQAGVGRAVAVAQTAEVGLVGR